MRYEYAATKDADGLWRWTRSNDHWFGPEYTDEEVAEEIKSLTEFAEHSAHRRPRGWDQTDGA